MSYSHPISRILILVILMGAWYSSTKSKENNPQTIATVERALSENLIRQPHKPQTGTKIELDSWDELADIINTAETKMLIISETGRYASTVRILLSIMSRPENKGGFYNINTILFWHTCPLLSISLKDSTNSEDLFLELKQIQAYI